MDVLSFYVTASILALSFDVVFFVVVVVFLLWLGEGGERESKKREGESRRIPHLFHKDAGKAYS